MLMRRTPKGMRDFLPEDMLLRERIFRIIRETYREFGFRPIETPAMEHLKVLEAKGGEEITGQIFRLDDKELGLKFEHTISLARMVSQHSFPKPFKAYQIGKVWRREEPQKGRYREFYQADADIIGTKDMRAEAELLHMAERTLERLGFPNVIFALSNRKVLNDIMKKKGLQEKTSKIMRVLDKLDKIGEEEVRKELKELNAEEILALLKTSDNEEALKVAEKFSEQGGKELKELLELYPKATIDLTMARGLAYYTGPIFEIKSKESSISIGGGGRYDEMISLFGAGDYATGISLGIDRIALLLGTDKKTPTKVFIANLEGFYTNAVELADYLRANKINAETDLNKRTLRKQLDYANSLEIPYLIVVGKKEAESKEYKLKTMATGEEKTLKKKELLELLGS